MSSNVSYVLGIGSLDVAEKIKGFLGVVLPVCPHKEDSPVFPQPDYLLSFLKSNCVSEVDVQ